MTGVGKDEIERLAAKQLAEIERRRALYLKDRQPVSVAGSTAIVVDDGIATGTTVKAALQALRKRNPKRLVLAVPVAPPDTIEELRSYVDEIVCLEQPEPFYAIGAFYRDFHQVDDVEVVEMLAASAHAVPVASLKA
jgi:putative phosphoribosyl transferase